MEQGLFYLQHQMAFHHTHSHLRGWERPDSGCTNNECLHHRQGYCWVWKLWNVYWKYQLLDSHDNAKRKTDVHLHCYANLGLGDGTWTSRKGIHNML